ncbi:MAG: hypothetical protein LKK00_06165 [Intestinimonas sp.]|jgi:hypothetical protein|nr:hypothetical protein [Intestinimonas sp.]
MNNNTHRAGARRVAQTAMMTGLSLLILWLSCLIPSGKLGIVAAAGLAPAAATVSGGVGAGLLCYAGTALLSLLLLPDKANALLYLIFFGLYPMVKCGIEQLRRFWPELLLKLLFFNGVLSACWFLLRWILMAEAVLSNVALWVVYLLGNVIFLFYDFGFSRLITFYSIRMNPFIKRTGR